MEPSPYQKIIKLLEDNHINYQLLDHEPVYTSEAAAKVRGVSAEEGAKSLLVKADNKFLLIVLPGSRKLDTKKLKEKFGIKDLRFARPEEVREIMGCEVGACYPFGGLINVKMLVDRSLFANEKISFNPGVHGKTIRMSLADYQKINWFEVVDLAQ